MIKCLAAVSLIIFLVIPTHASPEYLCLTANGNEMAPAICNGDSIIVILGADASLINPESRANPSSGDIIVYAATVAGYEGAMWTCGRVISKYFKDGHWCFKTKLDSRAKPDPWEVLDYEILGIVVDVVPNRNIQDKGSTTATSRKKESLATGDLRFGMPDFPTCVFDFSVGIALGAILGLTITRLVSRLYMIKDSRSRDLRENDGYRIH